MKKKKVNKIIFFQVFYLVGYIVQITGQIIELHLFYLKSPQKKYIYYKPLHLHFWFIDLTCGNRLLIIYPFLIFILQKN